MQKKIMKITSTLSILVDNPYFSWQNRLFSRYLFQSYPSSWEAPTLWLQWVVCGIWARVVPPSIFFRLCPKKIDFLLSYDWRHLFRWVEQIAFLLWIWLLCPLLLHQARFISILASFSQSNPKYSSLFILTDSIATRSSTFGHTVW